jgi:hypothetical protein
VAPTGSVWVVRMWCRICTDSILSCFVNLEVLSSGDLVVGMVPELLSSLNDVPS